jgi:hypothetical protein
MAEELNFDPAMRRSLRDAHHRLAAFYRQIAEPDMESIESLPRLGPAAQPTIDRATEWLLHHRTAQWNNVADMHHRIGDAHDMSLSSHESADAEAGGHIARGGENL